MASESAGGAGGSDAADAAPGAVERALRPLHAATAALQARRAAAAPPCVTHARVSRRRSARAASLRLGGAQSHGALLRHAPQRLTRAAPRSLAAAAGEIGAATAAALREASAGRVAAEQRSLALERELAAARATAEAERAEHAAALERARTQAADEHGRLLHELEAARAQVSQLRGADLEAASLRQALSAAEGRAASALSAAAAAAASLAALEAKHAESRSNYHRLYRKVMAGAPELLHQSRGAAAAPSPTAPPPPLFQPLLSRVEAALPGLLPSPPPPAPPPAAAAPPPPPQAAEAPSAAVAAPVTRAPPPALDTVESDWVIRSTPDEQLQPAATAEAAGTGAAAAAALPETNGEVDDDDDADAGLVAAGDADAAPGSEVTQCCGAAARGLPCAHRAWGRPVPVALLPPQQPPAAPAEKPWRKRGGAAGTAGGFLTDPAPRPAKRPAPAAADADADARYLFTPPPSDGGADAAADAPPGGARPPVALKDCSPLALPSPPRGARTVWTLDAADAPPRAGGGRRARPANERPAPPGGRYAEVERNRAARAAMPAFECAECRGFYAAMGLPAPPCQHGPAAAQREAVPPSHEEHLKAVGRHRAQWAPALTPAGFWNIGFGDESAPPPPEERTRVTKPINYCPGL